MKEIEIQSAILDYLAILERQGKLFFQRTNNNTIFDTKKNIHRSLAKGQKKGFPDVIVIISGLCIGIEIKSKTGRQSKEQKEIEAKFKSNGAEYYVVRSVEEVRKILNSSGGIQ